MKFSTIREGESTLTAAGILAIQKYRLEPEQIQRNQIMIKFSIVSKNRHVGLILMFKVGKKTARVIRCSATIKISAK